MGQRPTTEELTAFLRTFHNIQQVDVDQFWRSTTPELLQVVARPIDIKETFRFDRSVASGPTVTTLLTQTFGPTSVGRILIIRSVFWQRLGPNAPDSVNVSRTPGTTIMWEDGAPAGVPLGSENEPAGWGSRMPIVLYGDQTITFAFNIAAAVALEFRLDISGEEFDQPFRNVGT